MYIPKGDVKMTDTEKITLRDEELTKALISRLNRIEGQVRGIKGMIEKDSYCNDVLVQVAAARAALGAVSMSILENHMRQCLTQKIRAGDDDIIDELMGVIKKSL